MTIDRTKAIETLESAQAQAQAQRAELREWLCAYLGLEAGSQQAEAISRADDPTELSDDQLQLMVMCGAGIPPGCCLTEDQLDLVTKTLLERP